MKNLLASLLVMVLLATAAQATVFTTGYDGVLTPDVSTPLWHFPTEGGFGSGSHSTSGGILTSSTLASGANLNYRMYGGAGSAWNPTGLGSTLETRLKIDAQGPTVNFACSLGFYTGSRQWIFAMGLDKIIQIVDGPDPEVLVDLSNFTVLRFVVDESAGTLDLHVDGSTTALASFSGVATSINKIEFGDEFDGAIGTTQWDYLMWTNEVAEVPEPVTMALLSLGGACMFFRRLKR